MTRDVTQIAFSAARGEGDEVRDRADCRRRQPDRPDPGPRAGQLPRPTRVICGASSFRHRRARDVPRPCARQPRRSDPVVDGTERAKTRPAQPVRAPGCRAARPDHQRCYRRRTTAADRKGAQQEEFGVATATAQRAVVLLQRWGLIRVSRAAAVQSWFHAAMTRCLARRVC